MGKFDSSVHFIGDFDYSKFWTGRTGNAVQTSRVASKTASAGTENIKNSIYSSEIMKLHNIFEEGGPDIVSFSKKQIDEC